jgi:hypothetical protein
MDDEFIALGGDEHDDLEKVRGAVGTDHQPAVRVLAEVIDNQRVFNGVEDVEICDSDGQARGDSSPPTDRLATARLRRSSRRMRSPAIRAASGARIADAFVRNARTQTPFGRARISSHCSICVRQINTC